MISNFEIQISQKCLSRPESHFEAKPHSGRVSLAARSVLADVRVRWSVLRDGVSCATSHCHSSRRLMLREQGSPETQSHWRHGTSEDLLLQAACMWASQPSAPSRGVPDTPPATAREGGGVERREPSETKPVLPSVPEGRLPLPPQLS